MDKKSTQIFDTKNVIHGQWLLCWHCARAYRIHDIRVDNGFLLCGYEDCDTSMEYESWEWDEAREINPGFPEVPKHNVVYDIWSVKNE